MKQIVLKAPTTDIVPLSALSNEYFIQFINDGGVVSVDYNNQAMILAAKCDSRGRWGWREPFTCETYAWNTLSDSPTAVIQRTINDGFDGIYLFNTHQDFFLEAVKNKWK